MVCRRQRQQRRLKKLNLLLLISFFHFYTTGHSQVISGAMQFASPVVAKDSNSISLAYSNLFYFRDYEYFNRIQTGYTLFGTWQYPRLVLQPNKWLRLEAGALLQKDFGDKQLNRAWPMFSVQLQQKNLRIILGALEGNQTHGLTEPLIGLDKVIERPIEEGLQVKFNTKRITTDLWLDWELRQKENSTSPEELTGGLALNFLLTKPGKPFEVKIPIGFIMPHKGGQLDTNSSVVTTVFDRSIGISAEWKNPDTKKWLRQVKGDAHFTGYTLFQDKNIYPYSKGSGFLVNFLVKSKLDLSFLVSYWNGDKYVAPRGADLFESITSISGSNYKEADRQLLFFNLMYEKEFFPGFFIDARYSPYVDLNGNGKAEHAFLILFSYRNIFRLGTLKKG